MNLWAQQLAFFVESGMSRALSLPHFGQTILLAVTFDDNVMLLLI
jgi:hypothetical protein